MITIRYFCLVDIELLVVHVVSLLFIPAGESWTQQKIRLSQHGKVYVYSV